MAGAAFDASKAVLLGRFVGAAYTMYGQNPANLTPQLSTPEQKCIGWPEQKYISDLARRPPNWGPFRQASSLRGIIRRVIGAGRA
jgi:hypothetical protein